MKNCVINNSQKRVTATYGNYWGKNQYIVQKYVKKPALYKGHKYDFRIYVLITSVISPMTIYLYNDGLVRLASQKYEHNKNFDDAFTHLTNYSLNKNNTLLERNGSGDGFMSSRPLEVDRLDRNLKFLSALATQSKTTL